MEVIFLEYKEIGSRIRERRQELGISVQEIAFRLHMSKATIHRYESGDIRNIKLPVIESLAKELKCNAVWLIGKSDRKEAASEIVGNKRYNDIEKLIDDVIEHIKYTERLNCCDKRLLRPDRLSIISGLAVIKEMTVSRYKK